MYLAAAERGLDSSMFKKMTIGQIVDFCITYNERQTKKEEPPTIRKATQADINALFGG